MQPRKKNSALALAHDDLAAYAAAMWPPFELAPHHKALIDALERVEAGMFDRLLVCMPPRHGKSLLSSCLFPAWFLGRHPDRSIIATSYSAELALDFGRRVRGFVNDALHQAVFPTCATSTDNDAAHRFGTTAGGAYYALGAGGPVTGRGADVLLIDDPIKGREQAYSLTERKNLQSWYESTAYTRLQPGGAIVVIATRWHEADLTGWLLKEHASEGWKVISMPALAENGDALGRAEGEPLWPAKFPIETLDRIKEAIGTAAWLSLYQQRPAPEEGAVFHKEWWRTYRELQECRRILFSLDTAFKATQTSDFSVIEAWGETTTGYHLLHIWRERAEFPDLKRHAVALAEIWRPHVVLIEDAASGQSLIQSLQRETRLPVLPVKPSSDKVSRAHACSPMVEAGRVYLPESAPWLREFLDELTSFPSSPHDDLTDALTQALNYLRENGPCIDIGFQNRAAAAIRAATDHRWTIDQPENRLFARGEDIARREDRLLSLDRNSMRRRLRGF